jgi:hypothetical protein
MPIVSLPSPPVNSSTPKGVALPSIALILFGFFPILGLAEATFPALTKGIPHTEVVRRWGPASEKSHNETRRKETWTYGVKTVTFFQGLVATYDMEMARPTEVQRAPSYSFPPPTSEAPRENAFPLTSEETSALFSQIAEEGDAGVDSESPSIPVHQAPLSPLLPGRPLEFGGQQ